MLGASSLDPSSSASSWHSASASVGHPSSNSRPAKAPHSPKTEPTNLPNTFAHAGVKEEYSHIEPVASTSSGKSATSEESASCEADASRRQSMTSSSCPPVHCRRLTFRLPPKFAQRLKRIANKQPNTLGRIGVSKVKVGDGETVSVNDVPPPQPVKVEEKRPEQLPERSESRPPAPPPPQPSNPAPGSGPVCQPPPGYHAVQHQQEVGQVVAPHSMQRPPPINNNSPLLVNLLSSQQQPGMVGGPPPNVPPHHQSFSPAGSYMYPGGALPHQHPHPSNVAQPTGPPVMDPQQHMAMQQQMQMEHRQRMIMQQQQQAHAAAVAAAQAQQHSISGQPQQAPLTPGGFYSPATPVQQAQNQQRPPMGYVTQPQNPQMFAGQPQPPQQVPVNVQQQRMQTYPAHVKPGSMPSVSPAVPGQFRGPPLKRPCNLLLPRRKGNRRKSNSRRKLNWQRRRQRLLSSSSNRMPLRKPSNSNSSSTMSA